MIQLGTFMWAMVVMFAMVGFVRGSTKEMIALTGIVLAIFGLEQLRSLLLTPLFASASLSQQFYIYAGILIAVALVAYQTPGGVGIGKNSKDAREGLLEGLLGAAIGGLNAYILFGALWYYMDNLLYPLSPAIMAPPLDSASASLVQQLPMVWILQGDFLTLAMIILVLFVLIVLI